MSILIKEKDSKICYAGTSKIKNGQKSPHKQLEDNLEMKDFLLRNPGCQQSNLVVNKDLYISLGGFDDYIIPSIDKDYFVLAKEISILKKMHVSRFGWCISQTRIF